MTTDRDVDRLELILEMIGHLRRRLADRSEMALLTDIDELDLTAFRLAVIGEAGNRLLPEIRQRNDAIAWADMYRMRNTIVHDYGSVDAQFVWLTVQRDLSPLEAVCRAELARAGD